MTESYTFHVPVAQPNRLVNLLGALALALTDRMRVATEEAAGLSGAAPLAIVALQQFLGGARTEDLAQALGITHSGAVRLVDKLVAAGLVERRAGVDGRSGSIVLTTTGRQTSRRISQARAHAVEDVIADLDAGHRQALEPLIAQLVATEATHRLRAREAGDPPGGWLCRQCDFKACERPAGRCPAASAVQAVYETG